MDAALVAACEAGDADAVAQLLAAGADVNPALGPPLPLPARPRAQPRAPLEVAAWKGHLGIVELLLAAGADARSRECLASACRNGHIDVVVRLLQAGAELNSEALQIAVENGHAGVLAALLAHGRAGGLAMEARHLDRKLERAVERNRLDMCDLLVAAGANVQGPSSSNLHRSDALRVAARAGTVELVERLLRQGRNTPACARQASLDGALIQASWVGHAEVVRILLASGADVHAQGGMALVSACREGRTAIVPLLLDAGADVHANDDKALRSASAYGEADAVAALLAAGANVHAKDDEALASAAQLGYDAVVAQLLQAGADVRSGKYRAIKRALQNGHFSDPQERQRVLDHLVAAGAATWPQAGVVENATSAQTRFLAFVNQVVDLEQRLAAASERGDVADVDAVLATPSLARYVDVNNAFCRACGQGHEMVVARLIAAGADVHDGYYDMHGGTYVGPLLEACEASHVAVVALLAGAGANVNMLDGAPLQIACKFGHLSLLDWLLGHGADVHIDEDEALQTAAEYGQAEAIARLLAAGATINIGRGPIRAAVNSGHDMDRVAIARQLVDAGADLAMVDDDISLVLAAGYFGSLPLVELLLRAGANVHADNNRALADACEYGRFAVVERLIDAGANVACADWAYLPEQERARIALRDGGRRFAREYWAEGLPELGPVPSEFVFAD